MIKCECTTVEGFDEQGNQLPDHACIYQAVNIVRYMFAGKQHADLLCEIHTVKKLEEFANRPVKLTVEPIKD